MDIGPVRQRFTAEPISSPVPAEPAPEQIDEHVTVPATATTVPTARTRPEPTR